MVKSIYFHLLHEFCRFFDIPVIALSLFVPLYLSDFVVHEFTSFNKKAANSITVVGCSMHLCYTITAYGFIILSLPMTLP